jgi:hypothetical protein
MCKGITSLGRKCQGGTLNRDYCHFHNPQISNVEKSLNSIKYYFHWDNTPRQISIRPEFLENNTSEATRRHLYDEVMPFLRDCWKWGHPGTDRFSTDALRTYFPRIGVRENLTEEQLGDRQRTEAERRAEILRLTMPAAPPVFHRQNAVEAVGAMREIGAIGENVRILQRPLQPVPVVQQAVSKMPPPFKDSQNVHRTSINESVKKSIEIISADDWKMEVWPVMSKSGDKLPSCRVLLEKIYLWNPAFSLEVKEKYIWPKLFPLIDNNNIGILMKNDDIVYGRKPWVVLYKTFNWIFMQNAEVQHDALLRVLDELNEGREMCIAGKVSRIVNSLVGIHPDIHVGLSGKEMLQDRMSALAKRSNMDPETKMEEGRGILRDGNIPENEWEAWLEPLLLDY